jgi:addiction module RelE/StbE family toxin
MPVIWSPSALRQLVRIFDYLADFNPRSAAEVFKSLIETGDDLANFPQRGRLVRNSDMRELMTAYPYIIRYRVTRDEVRILRVRHTARRPTTP